MCTDENKDKSKILPPTPPFSTQVTVFLIAENY